MKEKVQVKEHVWIAHGHGQQYGDWLWEHGMGVGWAKEGKGGKLGQLQKNNNKIFNVKKVLLDGGSPI